MQLTIRIDVGGGPQDITTNLWAIVQWERKYKTKASAMAQAAGMEDIAYLAYVSMQAAKMTVPSEFDKFLQKIVTMEVVSSDDRPTLGEPTDDN
ncbi:MAG: hypothetical protein ACO3O3_11955 [Ilumatobacteraceae bacterium]